jgi:type IV pilus assembly protein PilN
MIRINLLPLRAERKTEDTRRMVSIYVLVVSLVLLILGWWHISGMRQASYLAGQVASNKAEIARYTKLSEEIKALQVQKAALENKLKVIQDLEKSKTGPVHMLDELASRLPVQRLWLTSLEQHSRSLKITGEALDNESIATYMRELGASDYISGVDLVSVEQKERDGVKLMDFSLTCVLSLTGSAPKPAEPEAGRRMAQR